MSSTAGPETNQTAGEAVELVRYGRDPAVNFGAAVIGHVLDAAGLATVTPTGVYANTAANSESIKQVLLDAAEARFSRNCVLTNAAERYNEWAVDQPGETPVVPMPSTAFQSITKPLPEAPFWPEGRFESPFDQNSITADELTTLGVPDDIQAKILGDSDSKNVYVFAPHYCGAADAIRGGRGDGPAKNIVQFAGWLRFLAQYQPTVDSDEMRTDQCGCCGGEKFPTSRIPSEFFPDDEGRTIGELEVGKTETPLVASGGGVQPLGYQYQTSKHPGRCVRCLVAGTFFNISNKPFVRTEETTEIITPTADLETLATVAGYTAVERDAGGIPDSQQTDINTNISELTGSSRSILRLGLFHELLQLTQEDAAASGGLFPTSEEVADSGEPVGTFQFKRGYNASERRWELTDFTETDPDTWGFRVVTERTLVDKQGNEQSYWPAETVLSEIDAIRDDDRRFERTKAQFAGGLLSRDFNEVAEALFQLLKELTGDAQPKQGFNPKHAVHYFTSLMTDANAAGETALTDDEVESLQTMAEAISDWVTTGSPVSKLNKLHRATSLGAFQEALSEVAFTVTKEAVSDPDGYLPNSDEFEPAVEALADPSKFEAARGQFLTLLNFHTAVSITRDAYENDN